jgi:hypothetical protein
MEINKERLQAVYDQTFTFDDRYIDANFEFKRPDFFTFESFRLQAIGHYYSYNIHGTIGNFSRTFAFTTFWFLWIGVLAAIVDYKYEAFVGISETNQNNYILVFKDFIIAYMASLSIFFWNFRTNYSDKWVYFSDLFNKSMELKFSDDEKKILKIVYIECCLSIDLINLTMWNDSSYQRVLKRQLFIARNYLHESDLSCITLQRELCELTAYEAIESVINLQLKLSKELSK